MGIRLKIKIYLWRTKLRWGNLKTLYRYYRVWRLSPDMRFWQMLEYFEEQQMKIQGRDNLFMVEDKVTRSIMKDWVK